MKRKKSACTLFQKNELFALSHSLNAFTITGTNSGRMLTMQEKSNPHKCPQKYKFFFKNLKGKKVTNHQTKSPFQTGS